MSVDLPTPDDPTAAPVRPPRGGAREVSIPSPVSAEVTWTGTPNVTVSTSATRGAESAHRSALVRTTTGSAPLSQARVM